MPLTKNLTQPDSRIKPSLRVPFDYTMAEKYQNTMGARSTEQVFALVDNFIAACGVSLGESFNWDNRSPSAGLRAVGAKCYLARWSTGEPQVLGYAHIIQHLAGVYSVFPSRDQGALTAVVVLDLDVRKGAFDLQDRISGIRKILSEFEVSSSLVATSTPSGGMHLTTFFRQPITPRQYTNLKSTLHKVVGIKPGSVEVFPNGTRDLRLPLGVKSALLDLDTWELQAGATSTLITRQGRSVKCLRRNIKASLAAFLKVAKKTWGGTVPPPMAQPSTTHIDFKGRKTPPSRYSSTRTLSQYLHEMRTLELSGVSGFGLRFKESGQLLNYLCRSQLCPVAEARVRYTTWLHLSTHQSKDLLGGRRNRVIRTMAREAERSFVKLAPPTSQHPAAARPPSSKYLDSRIGEAFTTRRKLPQPSPGPASLPWALLPPEILVGVCRMIRHLHEVLHTGAWGHLYISGLTFQKVLGKAPVSQKALEALPADWLACTEGFKGLAPVVRRILEKGQVLRVVEKYKRGQNVMKYEVCLDRLESALLLPKQPLDSLRRYMHNRSVKEVAATWGISTRLLNKVLNGTSDMPDTILGALAEEASFTPTLEGGESSLLTGDRHMAKQPKPLKEAVPVPLPEPTGIMAHFRKVMDSRIVPKYLSPEEPEIPDEVPYADMLANIWPEGFDFERLPDNTDLTRYASEAGERCSIQLECEHHDSVTPERQRALVNLLRVGSGSAESYYYGLLPILPRFPAKPSIPMKHLTNLPENFEQEAHRVLRAYNRVTSMLYKGNLWQGQPLPRAKLSDLQAAHKAERMKKIIAALHKASVTPERWMAWYCYHFIDNPKEPLTGFPLWGSAFGPELMEKCGDWCRHDVKVNLFFPGNRTNVEPLPRTVRFQAHYYDMIKFLSFAVLPSDGYIRQVVKRWFPGQSFGQEAAHCFVEHDLAAAELKRRHENGEWLWS